MLTRTEGTITYAGNGFNLQVYWNNLGLAQIIVKQLCQDQMLKIATSSTRVVQGTQMLTCDTSYSR